MYYLLNCESAIANPWCICLGVNILIPFSVPVGVNNSSSKSLKLLLGEALYDTSELTDSGEVY